jgi:hypothetical protein
MRDLETSMFENVPITLRNHAIDTPEIVCGRIRKVREEKRISILKLAARVGITPRESGSLKIVAHDPVARALEVTTGFLLTGNPNDAVQQITDLWSSELTEGDWWIPGWATYRVPASIIHGSPVRSLFNCQVASRE